MGKLNAAAAVLNEMPEITPAMVEAIKAQLAAKQPPASTPTDDGEGMIETIKVDLAEVEEIVNAGSDTPKKTLKEAVNPTPRKAGGVFGKIDFSDVPDQQMLPEDVDSEAEITGCELKESSNGNQMLALKLKVTFPLECKGVTLFTNVLLDHPKTKWVAKSLFAACDLLSEDGASFIGEDESDLLNCVVRFRAKHGEYQGRAKNEVAGAFSAAWESPGLEGG